MKSCEPLICCNIIVLFNGVEYTPTYNHCTPLVLFFSRSIVNFIFFIKYFFLLFVIV